jgi:hypothetical protein
MPNLYLRLLAQRKYVFFTLEKWSNIIVSCGGRDEKMKVRKEEKNGFVGV